MADRIVRDPKIVSGRPIVDGSLVTVEAVLKRLMAGYSITDIAKELPISIQDVRAAIEYAIESLPGSLPPPPKPAPITLSPEGDWHWFVTPTAIDQLIKIGSLPRTEESYQLAREVLGAQSMTARHIPDEMKTRTCSPRTRKSR